MKKLITLVLLLATVVSYAQVPSYVPTNGLVGYWPFNGNANDASGNSNNGTVNGATLSNDRFGNIAKAYNFNGSGNYIQIPYSSTLTPTTGTVAAWVKLDGLLNNQQQLFFGQNVGRPSLYCNSVLRCGVPKTTAISWRTTSVIEGTDYANSCGTTAIDDGNWHLILGTYTPSGLSIYVDGVLQNSITTGLLQNNSVFQDFFIGGFGPTAGNFQYFKGVIDEVYLWNRNITQQEITGLYTGVPANACVANIMQNDTAICSGQSLTLTASSVSPQSFTDIDGNAYPTVNIGGQTWMQKNLNVSRYRNGDIIPQVTNATQWASLTTGAWCWYNNDSATYAATYGKLYNWYAVNDPRGLAPDGWHVPANSEWSKMVKFIDPVADTVCLNCTQSNTAGGALKDTGTLLWNNPNLGATNSSGFKALPGGSRFGASFSNWRVLGLWWTSSSFNSSYSFYKSLSSQNATIGNGYITNFPANKSDGYSVRCVMDNPTFLWSTGATTPSISVSPVQSTIYKCAARVGGVSCTDSVSINVNQINRNFFPQDTIKACGTSYTLDAGAGTTYNWSTGATTRTINVTNTGRYRCTVTTNNCSASDSVFVSLVNANIVNNDTTICAGASITLSAVATSGGSPSTSLPANLRNGLVGYWPFNGNANDESGNGYNGTVNGATLTTDRFGNVGRAYEFDGVNDEISTTLNQLSSTSYTISVHFLGAIPQNNDAGMVVSRAGFNNIVGFSVGFEGSLSSIHNFISYCSNSSNYSYSGSGLFDASWHNFTTTYNNGVVKNYLDGNLVFTGGQSQQICVSAYFKFGNDDILNGRFFKGKLDDIGIWNRALGPDEVYQLYSSAAFLWSTGVNTPFVVVNPTQNTTYYVTVSNGISSCTDSVRVNVNQVNRNFFPQDTIKTCGTSYTLDAGAGNSYSWNTGATTRTINITSTGRYRCTVTTNNCTASDSVFVSLVNANILNNDTAICQGQNVTLYSAVATLSDVNGNIYPTINIGAQTWTQKNLNVSKYRNGDLIPQVTSKVQWANLTTGAWCWYNNDSATYASTYGKLYNWYAVNDSRGLAPEGWHIPLYGEWEALAAFLGGTGIAGGKMKEVGTTNWLSPNTGATNSSSFTGLPGGYRTNQGDFNQINSDGWWVVNSNNQPSFQNLYYANESINPTVLFGYYNLFSNSTGVSVRLIKDNSISNPQNYTFLWSTGENTANINVAPSQSTTYYVTVRNGISSCTDSVKVNVTQVNRNFFPQDTIRTCGNSLTLDAGAGNSYSWNTGATTRTISVSNSGRYRCTVTTNNCTATDSVFVSIVRANIINNDTTINAGSSLTLIADSSSFGTPRPNLLWSTGSTTTRTTVTPQTATTYTLRVTNGSSSCTDSVRVNINPLNLFTIRAATRTGCGPAEITSANTVDVPVTVDRFNRMVSLQGSIKWDSTVLRYQGISSFAPGIGLAAGNFNNTSANTLTFSWVDATLAGQTLADSSTLFTIRFNLASNARGRSTAISFENQPTLLEAVQGPATLLSVAPQSGNVRITTRPIFDTTRLSGCGSIQYNGATYTNSTSVNTTIPGPTGCDSIYRTAIITVNPVPVVNPVSTNSPILIGETLRFTVTGQNLEGGTFNWSGPSNFFSSLQNPTLIAAANTSGQYRMIYTSTCRRDTQNVSVTVNAGISGRIVSPLNQPVSRVNLLRNNVPTLVNGSYSIAVNPATPLVLKAAKNNDVSKINGVSVIDVVLIQNHILQRTLLNSPYKIIAGDVNRSGTLTSFDLVYMQRLILGLDTTFPGNTLWAFADSSYNFPNPFNPFPYKDSFSYTSATLQTNRANQTFIGMKLGDVNYDWNAQQLRPVPLEDVMLYHEDVQPEGNTIRIPVKVKNLKEVLGMQFTLQYNSSALRFRSIENNRLNLKYGNTRSGEGLLSFIWNDGQNRSVTLSDDAVLMELLFDKTGEFISEDIQLVNTIAPIEAWDKNYRKHNIIKGRGRILNNIKPGTPGWTVSPNPTAGQVVVNLTLQMAQRVELLLTTADGRVLKTWKQNFAAGTSAWPLGLKSGGYLPAGMYWMKMPEVDGVVRKIVIE